MNTKLEKTSTSSDVAPDPGENGAPGGLRIQLPGVAAWLHARRKSIGAVALVVLVAAVTTDAILLVRDGGNESKNVTPQEMVAAAEQILPEVLSYEFSALDDYRGRVDDRTTGEFRERLNDLIDTRIAKVARRDKLVTRATVPAVGVVSIGEHEVVVLAFVNQVTRRGRNGHPSIEGSRVRVTLALDGDDWKIAELDPV